jgi:DNA-binding HxlR family transcriptional regulator
MHREPNGRKANRDVWTVERAVVLQVLREDHEERWPRMELAQEISDFEPAVLEKALGRLGRDGVLRREGDSVWAACAARRLDELELIGV